MRQLLVQIAAQPFQLVVVAQIFGGDDLVELRREGVILRPARLVGAAIVRTGGFARRFVLAEFGIVEGVGGRRLGAFHLAVADLVAGRFGLLGAHLLRGFALRLALGAGLIVLAFLLIVLVLVFVGLGVAIIAKLECVEHVVDHVTELGLVVGEVFELIEPRPKLVFEHRPPQVDQFLGRRGRRETRQPLAHQHSQRIRQRRIRAVGDLVELAAMEMIVEHRREVLGDARHPPRAERFDARLLDRFEHAAGLRITRHQLAMHFRVVTGELQRDRVGVTAHNRGVALAHLARRLGEPRLAGREAGALGCESNLQLRRLGDGAQARGHGALERLGRRFLRSGAEFAVGRGAHSAFMNQCRVTSSG